MQRASRKSNKYHQRSQTRVCNAFCCNRLSVSSSSSSEEAQSCSGSSSDRYPAISSLTHAMVQERLGQIIRERRYEELARRRRNSNSNTNNDKSNSNSKFIVMVAMEKCSYDPREDFKESMVQMIVRNKIRDPKDLRRLLNCYVSINSEESREVILDVFHQVCTTLFVSSSSSSCRLFHGSSNWI